MPSLRRKIRRQVDSSRTTTLPTDREWFCYRLYPLILVKMPSSDDEDDDLLAPVFSTKLRKEPTPCSLSLALGGNSVGKESTNETIIKQIKKETYDVCFDEVKKRGKPIVESLLTTTILLCYIIQISQPCFPPTIYRTQLKGP